MSWNDVLMIWCYVLEQTAIDSDYFISYFIFFSLCQAHLNMASDIGAYHLGNS